MGRIIPNEASWIGFSPTVNGVKLAAPVQAAGATATTGGTLPSSTTYFYKITAINTRGETIGSNEVSVTTGAGTQTNTITVNWATVTGATGFKVYRGVAAGQENILVTTTGVVVTATDTGAATTYGVPPLINTTGIYVGIANINSPSLSTELNNAVDLTAFVISITANTTGNIVPVPSLKTKFETSIQGTVGATFTADFYRDDQSDLAWVVLPRGTKGFFTISRFGGSSGSNPGYVTAGDVVEVWPVIVVARSASNLSSNTAEMFTLQCSVPTQPNEASVVVA